MPRRGEWPRPHRGPAEVNRDLIDELRAAARRLRVMVVGSLNMDVLLNVESIPETDSATRVDSLLRCPGGHAGNCATALAALGASVSLLAMVGKDADGDALVEDLAASGVATDHVRRSPRSGTGQVFIPTAGARHFMLLWRGANDDLDENLAATVAAFAPAAVVGFDPPHALLAQMSRLRGLDPRPSAYWCPGPVNARNPDGIVDRVAPFVDVMMLNETEETSLAAAGALPEVAELVTTLGAKGARARCGDAVHSSPARNVKVVDTIGSGDAFLAAYLLAREAALPVRQRLEVANAYAALAATGRGARGGLAPLERLIEACAEPENAE